MTSRDFAYWLQGFFELSKPENLTPEQLKTIKNHLNMVFHHEIDPSFGSKQHVDDLTRIHDGKSILSGLLSSTMDAKVNC
jgi:uncharacterized protein YfkK (UPF0435 family)